MEHEIVSAQIPTSLRFGRLIAARIDAHSRAGSWIVRRSVRTSCLFRTTIVHGLSGDKAVQTGCVTSIMNMDRIVGTHWREPSCICTLVYGSRTYGFQSAIDLGLHVKSPMCAMNKAPDESPQMVVSSLRVSCPLFQPTGYPNGLFVNRRRISGIRTERRAKRRITASKRRMSWDKEDMEVGQKSSRLKVKGPPYKVMAMRKALTASDDVSVTESSASEIEYLESKASVARW
ncbi:hypothetical protein C8R47DRAFT_1091600 [Mycena vitilis]|nr:hypothetical protein C8R47DRAFT_1091600 [Mycena vitilis]